MNCIVMKYSYFSQKPELTMNGESMSPYSELTALLNRPFLEIVDKLLYELDKEIFDDYEIELYAMAFHFEMLTAAAANSAYCKKIHYHKIESLIPENHLLQRLFTICKEYNISVETKRNVKFFCADESFTFPAQQYFEHTKSPNADIGILEADDTVPQAVRTVVVLSETFGISQKIGRTCFLVPKEKITLFWEYYEFEYVVLPIVAEYLTALRYVNLSEEHKVEIAAYKTNQAAYYLSDFCQSVDRGEKTKVTFVSFPVDYYALKSENPQIASYDGSFVSALTPGTANFAVVAKGGKVVESKTINVIGHQYAEEIRLIPRFDYLKRNERNRIDLVVAPSNAEDVNELTWHNSNPEVLQIDENGNVIAMDQGKALITVSGKEVATSIEVEVKPALQSLSFSQQSVRLKCGETIVLDCHVAPKDAPMENLTWEIDNKTIASLNPAKNGRRCQVIAATGYEGKGNIRCYDPISKLGAICNIEVILKIRQSTLGKAALACFLFGIIMPLILPVSIGCGIAGLITDKETERHMRYIICVAGSIIAGIIWIITAMGA